MEREKRIKLINSIRRNDYAIIAEWKLRAYTKSSSRSRREEGRES